MMMTADVVAAMDVVDVDADAEIVNLRKHRHTTWQVKALQ